MVQRRHNVIAVTLNSTTAPAVDDWFGFAILENASTAAATEVLFKDGSSTGILLWPVQVGANGSKESVWETPIRVPSGVLHVDSTGAILGVVLI